MQEALDLICSPTTDSFPSGDGMIKTCEITKGLGELGREEEIVLEKQH